MSTTERSVVPAADPAARPAVGDEERLRRWRLILGGADDGTGVGLTGDDLRIDTALGAVYDTEPERFGRRRKGGLSGSAPAVARWLGDIRQLFPTPVVQVIQKDALERLGLERLLLEPEILASVQPDVHLVATIVELAALLPDTARHAARQVVREVVADLQRRLARHAVAAARGAIAREARTRRPRPADIDWLRTIEANLRHYQPRLGTVIPERIVGNARRRRALGKELIIAIDQSGSMADSVVHAGVLSCALARVGSLHTSVVAFDTAVVDLTDLLDDPVELLFGIQLGGGTDIDRAVAYCESLITRPADTLLIILSDLFEGGDEDSLVARLAHLVGRGVRCVALLALSDDGTPAHNHALAARLAAAGVPAIACTPDRFPDVLARYL